MAYLLDYERFSAANIEPYRFRDYERHQAALRDANELITLKSHAGQSFSGLHLNRESSNSPVIVRIGAMNNSSLTEAQKYTAYQYAAGFPDNPFIAIDLTSHGVSDRPTFAQRVERLAKRAGSLTAAAQAEAIANYMSESQEFIIVGDSFGAQLVPDVAYKLGAMGLSPLAIVCFEMFGVNHFDTWQTFLKLNKNRRNGHAIYHEGEDNKRLDAAYDNFCAELAVIGKSEQYNPFRVGKRDPIFTALSILRSATNSERGMEALEQVLEVENQMTAALVSGGLSRICDWRKIEPRVAQLERRFNGRFSWTIWPHDSHSMSIPPQQPRSVAFVRAVIESCTYKFKEA